MRILILGAGLIGTTSAWYLAQAGHEVTVLDRQPGPGLETSFANGGQISVSHAEPWASPKAIGQLWQWLGREDAPLYFKLRPSLAQWLWGLKFLGQCNAKSFERNCKALLELGLYSRAALQELRAQTSLQYDQRTNGILHFFTKEADFADAQHHAAKYRERGLDVTVKSAAQVLEIEPAFQHSPVKLAGGTYTASDETGDALKFTQELARLCTARGVQFRYGTSIAALERDGGKITGVRIAGVNGFERMTADAYVVAMGSYSPILLSGLGLRLPVYPLKGYSLTAPIKDETRINSVSITDEDAKIVVTRLGERIRSAGTAELNNYETHLSPIRTQAILRQARALFPDGAHWDQASFWAGLRPATPTNNPMIGKILPQRYPNLYVNTGHGTLGWTLACGSGKVLADVVDGRKPSVDLLYQFS